MNKLFSVIIPLILSLVLSACSDPEKEQENIEKGFHCLNWLGRHSDLIDEIKPSLHDPPASSIPVQV